MAHLLGKLCNYGAEHLKLEHLPAGRRVTERKEKEYQVSDGLSTPYVCFLKGLK